MSACGRRKTYRWECADHSDQEDVQKKWGASLLILHVQRPSPSWSCHLHSLQSPVSLMGTLAQQEPWRRGAAPLETQQRHHWQDRQLQFRPISVRKCFHWSKCESDSKRHGVNVDVAHLLFLCYIKLWVIFLGKGIFIQKLSFNFLNSFMFFMHLQTFFHPSDTYFVANMLCTWHFLPLECFHRFSFFLSYVICHIYF